MKKKNIFAIVLAMALVAVVSVGATLAFLTAETKDVKNTFKFADGMEVELEEPTPTPTADVTVSPNPDGGYDYTNIVPGLTMEKNPRVYTTTPVDAYLFVKIEGASELMMPTDINLTEWKPVDAAKIDKWGNGVYYMEVAGSDTRQGPFDVFEHVKVGDVAINNAKLDGKEEVTIDDIVVKVYEIQKEGLSVTEAEAQCKWNQTTTGGTGTEGGDPVVNPDPVENPDTPAA